MIGETVERSSKSTKEYGEELKAITNISLEQVQTELIQGLRKCRRELLIVLDDLERLTPDQVLLVFQIVKLNACLPCVHYLLLMDKETVQKHLGTKQIGPEYLEKIVQYDFSLPQVSEAELRVIVQDGFKFVMRNYAEKINWTRWEDAWTNGCQNIFTTLRRIKRFLLTLDFQVGLFSNGAVLEVDPVDLFLVEALRKYAPEVHSQIPRLLSDLIFHNRILERFMLSKESKETNIWKIDLDRLAKLAPQGLKPEIEIILRALFPQVSNTNAYQKENEWIRDTRICHQLFFESYFRLAIPRQSLTQKEIKSLFDLQNDKAHLRNVLGDLYQKYGLKDLLVRIQCHHAEWKPERLPFLLIELWRLDEKDAQKAGIDRKWDTRDSVQSITRFLLKTYFAKENRVKVILDVLSESGAIYTLTRFIHSELTELKEMPYSTGPAFDNDQLQLLQKSVVEEIHKAATAGKILDSPDSGVLLFIWSELENVDAVKTWIAQAIENRDKLALILSRFIFKTTVSDHTGTRIYYAITRKSLEKIFTLNDKFEQKIKSIDLSILSHWEKFAVEQTLKRIEEKKLGMEEAEYPEAEGLR